MQEIPSPRIKHSPAMTSSYPVIMASLHSASSNTTNNWYLGIWFNKVPKLIPVWVANRQNPIIDPTITELTLYLDGNLVILDKVAKSMIWSTQIGNKSKGNYTTAVLLNNGKLVLRESSNMSIMLWQSFDYPADALLPGAKGWSEQGEWFAIQSYLQEQHA
jgi:hypothetical protein